MCSAEPEVIRGNLRIPKNEASQEPEKNGMHNLAAGGGKCGHSRERSLDGIREYRLAGPSGQAWSIRLAGDGQGTAEGGEGVFPTAVSYSLLGKICGEGFP